MLTESEVNDLLFDEWDPIGVNDAAPRDEYIRYAREILQLLQQGAGRDDIVDYLTWAVAENMTLVPDVALNHKTATQLVARYGAPAGPWDRFA
jgi:hypothetical protein